MKYHNAEVGRVPHYEDVEFSGSIKMALEMVEVTLDGPVIVRVEQGPDWGSHPIRSAEIAAAANEQAVGCTINGYTTDTAPFVPPLTLGEDKENPFPEGDTLGVELWGGDSKLNN